MPASDALIGQGLKPSPYAEAMETIEDLRACLDMANERLVYWIDKARRLEEGIDKPTLNTL